MSQLPTTKFPPESKNLQEQKSQKPSPIQEENQTEQEEKQPLPKAKQLLTEEEIHFLSNHVIVALGFLGTPLDAALIDNFVDPAKSLEEAIVLGKPTWIGRMCQASFVKVDDTLQFDATRSTESLIVSTTGVHLKMDLYDPNKIDIGKSLAVEPLVPWVGVQPYLESLFAVSLIGVKDPNFKKYFNVLKNGVSSCNYLVCRIIGTRLPVNKSRPLFQQQVSLLEIGNEAILRGPGTVLSVPTINARGSVEVFPEISCILMLKAQYLPIIQHYFYANESIPLDCFVLLYNNDEEVSSRSQESINILRDTVKFMVEEAEKLGIRTIRVPNPKLYLPMVTYSSQVFQPNNTDFLIWANSIKYFPDLTNEIKRNLRELSGIQFPQPEPTEEVVNLAPSLSGVS